MKISFMAMVIVLMTLRSSFQGMMAGGNSVYTDTNSPEFQKILAYAKANRPILRNLTPTAVYTQVVNGRNYIILFAPTTGCSAEVIIHSITG